MKTIKWLSELAKRNPLLFSLVLMMLAISAMASVIIELDNKGTDCILERREIEHYYRMQIDSIQTYYRKREYQLNEEVKTTLNSVINNYKEQLEEQKHLSNKVTKTIKHNDKLISNNKKRIKNLE